MKNVATGLLLVVMALGACSKDKKAIKLTDASDDSGSSICDAIAQTGCAATEKCTWVHDDLGDATSDPPKPADGHIGCVPADTSTVDIKGACTYGAPGATGYDNCKAGLLCDVDKAGVATGRCEQVCDATLGTNCENNLGCVRRNGVFAAVGAGDATTPGTCQILCDPLLDNDYDGAGTLSQVRAGTPCDSDANAGCWGLPRGGGTTTFFFCAHSVPGTENLVHREVIPADKILLDSCHPGYSLGFKIDATGSTNEDCYAYCAPADAIGSSGSGTVGSASSAIGTPIALPNPQRPNGNPVDPCGVVKGRTGNFGDVPNGIPGSGDVGTSKENGEHCMYSWHFEFNAAGDTLFPSPTSDTVGFCFDHSKYTDTPACTAIAASDLTPDHAELTGFDLGCMSLKTYGIVAGPITGKAAPFHLPEGMKIKRFPVEFPSLDSRWQSAAMRH